MESFIFLNNPCFVKELNFLIIAYNFENIIFRYLNSDNIMTDNINELTVFYFEKSASLLKFKAILHKIAKDDYYSKINELNYLNEKLPSNNEINLDYFFPAEV